MHKNNFIEIDLDKIVKKNIPRGLLHLCEESFKKVY